MKYLRKGLCRNELGREKIVTVRILNSEGGNYSFGVSSRVFNDRGQTRNALIRFVGDVDKLFLGDQSAFEEGD
jgi:hypothetical protein